MPYDENDPRRLNAGATFDQAAGGATPSAAFDRAANTPLERPAIGGRFREGSIGTVPVGSVDYTTTAGQPNGATGDFEGTTGATGSWGASSVSNYRNLMDQGNAAIAAGDSARGYGIKTRAVISGLPQDLMNNAVESWTPVAEGAQKFLGGAFGVSPGPIASAAAASPQNAVPGASVMVPRGPSPQYGNEGRGGPPADPYGPGQSVPVTQGGGTLSMAGRTATLPAAPAGGITDQQAQAIIGNPLINAELQRYQAQDAQRVQASNEAMRQNGAWADAWTAQRDAEGKARVANFQARNGADMVLAGGNSRNNPAQTAILSQQAAANAGLSEANKNLAGVYGQKGPITDFVGQQQKQQALDQQGRQHATDAAAKQADTEGKQLDAASKKQILELQNRLLTAKTPEERKSIEDMIVAIHGRAAQQDKVALVDAVIGEEPDPMTGGMKPKYGKVAVNTVTGQLVGQQQQPAAKQPTSVAHAEAKQALAAGMKLDEVNKRLVAAGHPKLP